MRGEVDHEWHIYFDDTKPASLYGGTWEELPQGTFIMAAGEGNAASTKVVDHGNPGGMHTMTNSELASHNHAEYVYSADFGDVTTVAPRTVIHENIQGHRLSFDRQNMQHTATMGGSTDVQGQSQPFDIRPPTVTAHVWRKIS